MKVFSRMLAGSALAVCACSTQLPPPAPPTFARPERVAFACFDAATNTVHNLDECKPNVSSTLVVTPSALSLHALVTQSNRGEVAAVDLAAAQVIDSRHDIPGYTFVPAGELPSAIVVPPHHPQFTYVANSGSRDISVLRTQAFRELKVGENATRQRIRVVNEAAGPAASPFDMVLSPDEDALFVSAPESGWLLRFPILRCDNDGSCPDGEIDTENVQQIPLEQSLAKAVPAPAPGAADAEDPYRVLCAETSLLPPSTPVATELPKGAAGLVPRPAGLAVDSFCQDGADTCTRRLLVADKRLPIVHVIDLDVLAAGDATAAILAPIVTGVPTERVAVSPRVLVEPADPDRETQYVYAIDATDGSVIVSQDGRVLNVASDPTARATRLDLGNSTASGAPVAVSLGVLTPGFDVKGPAAQWVETDTADLQCSDTRADRLRGVFLAVGLTDGTVRIVDVHDMTLANCRSCQFGAVDYNPYPLLRHRPRIGLTLPKATAGTAIQPLLSTSVAPQFEIATDVVYVNADGTTNDPRVPGLGCVTCPATQTASFPVVVPAASAEGMANGGAGATNGEAGAGSGGSGAGEAGSAAVAPISNGMCRSGQARVCSLSDPWIDPVLWFAYLDGLIPGASGGRGRFVADDNVTGSVEFAGEAHFCATGVLGSDDLGVVGGVPSATGDQLEITSALPVDDSGQIDPQLRADCESLVRMRDEEHHPIAFPISRAYADRLVIGTDLITPPLDVKRRPLDYAFVKQCFGGMLMTFEVHVRNGYSVVSRSKGFLHRVVQDSASGRCVIDVKQDPRRTGRAYDGVPFDNGFVSFNIVKPPTEPGALLSLPGEGAMPKLILDASAVSGGFIRGVMPVDLQFSEIDQKLYVVDITQRGLIPVPLDMFPSAVLTSFQ